MKSSFTKYIAIFAAFLTVAFGQNTPFDFSLKKGTETTANASSSQLSNSITDIVISGDTVWLGTGKGLSRSTDGGATWKNYFQSAEFGEEDISAIAVSGKNIWAATAHSVEKDGQNLPVGSGLRHSSDGGETWEIIPQPVDVNNIDTLYYNDKSFIRALGITTEINNITYDIALSKNTVWICSFAGMARKSTDSGKTWQRVILPPDNLNSIALTDSLVFDLSPSGGALELQNNLNHRAFSVLTENDSTIWIGTAGGINKSTDGGISWIRYTKQNQLDPISGNFVVALGNQIVGSTHTIWAATINANDPTEKRGVSVTTDGGTTWKQELLGEFSHNFGFKNSFVYVPTDNGVWRSSDKGSSWIKTGTIYDPRKNQLYTQSNFFAAAVHQDVVWLGGADGIALTTDNSTTPFGTSWTLLHSSVASTFAGNSYAYPNPFAPDDEVVRIHYTSEGILGIVSIHIFDFGMNLVKTVIQKTIRSGDTEHDEIWDGKDEFGNFVSNGVYFYRIILPNHEPIWGKILVIR